MGIFKNELHDYNVVPRELVFDSTLSDRARFVYLFMACKPQDWDFLLEPMAKEIGYSVDTLRKYINELVASGWLVKGEQQKKNGQFSAVDFILKATKNTDTEKTRHGENPILHNNITINSNIKDIDINERNNIKELKEKFANFVSSYKKMGGRVRGVETEFNDFTKRHKDWRQVLPYLLLALQREIKERNRAKAEHRFFPEPKNLQTYLGKQRAWELYATVGEDITDEEYTPICGGALNWNDYYGCYLYIGMFYENLSDGYTSDNRPNGARIMLNNGRGFIRWNSETQTWDKE